MPFKEGRLIERAAALDRQRQLVDRGGALVLGQQGGDGGTTVQMLSGGTPIQISGVTGSVIMKQEPSEAGGGISLTPVSISNNGQVSYCYSRCLRT